MMNNRDSNIEKGEGESKVNTEGWMTTFSDLCMLLLTFFVLLFSLGSMDNKKLKIAFQNFAGSSGFLFFKEYREIARPKEIFIDSMTELLGDKVVIGGDIRRDKALDTGEIDTRDLTGVGSFLIINHLKDGLKLVFGERLLFPPGSVEMKEDIKPVLHRLGRFISLSSYQAYIDGHTDNVSIRTGEFPTNEELSIARAFNIWDYLVRVEMVSPQSIALIGYGALKPIGSNDSPEGRAKNRRVEIILKNQTYF